MGRAAVSSRTNRFDFLPFIADSAEDGRPGRSGRHFALPARQRCTFFAKNPHVLLVSCLSDGILEWLQLLVMILNNVLIRGKGLS
jgi:hypothetical protein